MESLCLRLDFGLLFAQKRLLESLDGPGSMGAGSGLNSPDKGVTRGGNLNKRSQHIVDRAFQTRVATSLTVMSMLVPVILLLGAWLVWKFAVIQNPPLAELPMGWKLIGAVLKTHWWIGVLCFAAFVAFTFALVFYYTHRIAGPVYRFRWLFDELAEGRIHTQVQLRDGDCFENLAASLLRVNATLASSVAHLKEAAAAASKEAEPIKNAALNEQLGAIHHILDRYSVMSPPPAESSS